MEKLKQTIQQNKFLLPALSCFWEVKKLPGDTKSVVSKYYNTSKFRVHAAHKVISTSVDFSILLNK
jgi:hypothetical protein